MQNFHRNWWNFLWHNLPYGEAHYPDEGSNCWPVLDIFWVCALTIVSGMLCNICVNSLLCRIDVLINQNPTIEKHHQLDLQCQFLMFYSPFCSHISLLHLSFGIVVVNLRFVENDHFLAIPVIGIFRFFLVFLRQPETKSHLFSCEQIISFWVSASVFGFLTFSTCSRGSPMF